MKWRKDTTCWQAFAGTCATLSSTMPKEVKKLVSSSTVSTSSWSFCTSEATERFLQDLKAMRMHQEMMPQMRSILLVLCNEKNELFEVWEVLEKVPPSTNLELELNSSPPGSASPAKRVPVLA